MIYAVLPEKKLSELEANLISQTLNLQPPWQGRHSEHLYFSHLAPEKTQKLLLATKEFTRALLPRSGAAYLPKALPMAEGRAS